MKEWTDLDYAQAAIDMLPGSVEEIEEFLKAQRLRGIDQGAYNCPVAKWVSRWTGERSASGVWQCWPNDDAEEVRLPRPVSDFVLAFDRGQTSF